MTINGDGAGNQLTDTSGDDTIVAGGGDDTITVSQGGTDTVDGGTGEDRLILDARVRGGAVSIPVPTQNADGLSGTASWSGTSVSFRGIENFTVFTSSTAFVNGSINLGGGNDSATVVNGSDTVHAGAGTDTLIIDWSGTDGAVRIAMSLAPDSAGGFRGQFDDSGRTGRAVNFSGIEQFNITTGSADDNVTTGSGDDVVRLNAGNDFANVGGGNITADGGDGSDGISADLATATSDFVWNLQTNSYSGPAGASFTNFEYLGTLSTGSGNDQIVTTSVVRGETLNLGDGDDSATVVHGSDKVNGGAGTDTLVIDWSGTDGMVRNSIGLVSDGAGGFSGQFDDAGRTGRVVSFSGIERFNITGGSADDSITTGDGADIIQSGSGADTVNAAGGDDTINGGTGDDTINGGTGDDTITVTGGTDTVDGGAGTDRLILDARALGGSVSMAAPSTTTSPLSGSAGWSFTTVNYRNIENFTIYSSDGNNGDVVTTGSGDDVFFHYGRNDPFYLSDNVDLGSGTNDLLVADFRAVTSYEVGNTFVHPTPGYSLFTVNNGGKIEYINVERIQFFGGSLGDTVVGQVGADELNGLAGDDTLSGGTGNDVIDGGVGNDTLDGGDNIDTLSHASLTGGNGVTVSLATAGAQATGGGGTDTISNFENLTGSSFDDVLTGDAGGNVIEGGSGDDQLDGGGSEDTVSYASATSGVTVSLANLSAQNTGGAGTDTLSNFENLSGSALADTLTGDLSVNVITGGAGDDTIDGGSGTSSDDLAGGGGIDTVSYASLTGDTGVVVNLTTQGADFIDTVGDGSDRLNGFENVTGSRLADTLTGDADSNVIDGGAGDDSLTGGAGDDTIIGGAGTDAANYLTGTPSDGLVDRSGENRTITTGGDGTDTLSGIETLRFAGADGNIGGGDDRVFTSVNGNFTVQTADDTGAAREAGGTANGTAGTNAAGNVLDNDINLDADATDSETVTQVAWTGASGPGTGSGTSATVTSGGTAVAAGIYGDLSIGSNGAYTYTLDAARSDLLKAGEQASETFTYTVDDGSGNPQTATITITVTGSNDAPIVTGLATSAQFGENTVNAAPQLIDNDGVVLADAEGNFDGGTLVLNGAVAGDIIGIRNQGTSSGLIGVTGGNTVTFGNVAIGTFSGGDGTNALVITLNGNATTAAVDALITNLTFATSAQTPTTTEGEANPVLSRLVKLTLTDQTGGSFSQDISIDVQAQNDAPSGTDTAVTILEDNVLVLTQSMLGFSDLDGNSFKAVRFGSAPTGGTLFFDADGSGSGAPVGITSFPSADFTAADLAAGKVTFVPDANRTADASIQFTVLDDGGTEGGGINADSTPNTLTVNITPVNDGPVNSVPGTQTVLEDGTLTFSAANGNAISIADVDAGSGSIQVIVSAADGALNGVATAGVTISGNGGNSVTLSGATAAVNAALDGLTYAPPANANGARAITVSTSDGGNTGGGSLSDSDTITVNITGVNDSPTASVAPSYSATEQTALSLKGTLSIADIDAGEGIVMATLSVGHGALDLSVGNSGAQIVSGNGGASVVVSGTVAQINALLGSASTSTSKVTFTATGDAPPSSTSLTLSVNDQGHGPRSPELLVNGGFETQDGNNDAGDFTTAGGQTFDGVAFRETSELFGWQRTNPDANFELNTNVSSSRFSAADGDTVTNLEGSGANGNQGIFQDVSGLQAGTQLTLSFSIAEYPTTAQDYSARMEVVWNGVVIDTLTPSEFQMTRHSYTLTAAVTGTGVDGANRLLFREVGAGADFIGTSLDGVSLRVASPQLTGSDTATIDITPVNDAPEGADKTVTILEDGSYTFTAADFGFSDVDGNAPLFVKLSSLPVNGKLFTDGAEVSEAGGFIFFSDIAAGKLVYVPAANGNGNNYASFTFQVGDDGGAANGGQNTDQSANTFTLDVTAVNDAPVLMPVPTADATYTENMPNSAPLFQGLTVTDPDAPGNFAGGSLKLQVTTGATTGDFIGFTNGEGFVFTGSGFTYNGAFFANVNRTSNGLFELTGFTSTATPALINQLIDNFTFVISSENPATHDRIVTLTFNDGGNTGSGGALSSSLTQTVHVVAVNDAPFVGTTGGTRAFVEGVNTPSTPIVVDPGVTVSDVDNATLSSATVSITANFQAGQDSLAFTNNNATDFGNIAASYDSATGVLTLTSAGASATVSQFQNALRAVTYDNSSEEPNTADRTISFVANDGTDASASKTKLVSVTANNDAPSGTSSTVAISEDQVVTLNASHFGFSDVDGDAFAGVKFSGPPSGGALFFDADGAGAGEPAAITTFPTPTYSAADIAAGKLTFVPTLNSNGDGAASLTFALVDDGGTAGTGDDTDPTPETLTFDISPVNDAPGLTPGDNVSVNEDSGSRTFENWATNINPGPDNESAQGYSISTEVVSGNVTFAQTPFVHVLTGDLRFEAAANSSGTATVRVTIKDDGGTPGVAADDLSQTYEFTITVNPVNDAPEGGAPTATILEDTARTLSAGDFGFSDPDGHAFAGVVIASTGTGGTVRLDGAAVTAGQFVSAADIAANKLVFSPALNHNGPASFTFQVRDAGPNDSAIGDQNTDQTPNTFAFSVTGVNDAPAGANGTVTVEIDSAPRPFTAADFGFTDVDGNGFAGVVITNPPSEGTLLVDGVPVTDGQFVAAADIEAGKFTFQPDPSESGTGYATVTFQVRDNGGVANNGVDTDPTANTVTINVKPANFVPELDLDDVASGSGFAGSFSEGGAAAGIAANVAVSDVENNAITGATVTITDTQVGDTLSLAGTLPSGISSSLAVVDGKAVLTLSGTASAEDYEAALELVRFSSTSEDPTSAGGAPTRTIVTTVRDAFGSSLPATSTIAVTGVNDAPVNANVGADGGAEDTSFAITGLSVSDVDAGGQNITVTLSVSRGTLNIATGLANGVSDAQVSENGSGSVTITASQSQINATLAATNGLLFGGGTNANGQVTLTLTTSDGGSTGTGETGIDTDQYLISISAVNDAPVVIGDGDESGVIAEDTPSGGQTVSNIFSGQYSDAADNQSGFTGGSSPGAFGGIAVVANSSGADGQWQYLKAGVWTDIGAASESAAKILGPQTLIRFSPAANFNGAAPSLSVRLIDNSATFTPDGGTVDLTGPGATGGTSPYSAGTVTLGQTVTPVNDAPSGTSSTVTINEDAPRVLSAADFPFTDVEGHALHSVTIESLSGGVILFDADGAGSAAAVQVTTPRTFSAADLAAGKIVFEPTANLNGTGAGSIAFRVQDAGGTPGQDSDESANALTIDITAVNDAPSGTDNSKTINEDGSYVLNVADFGFSDVDGHSFDRVIITNAPTNGQLLLDADGDGGSPPTPVASTATVSRALIEAGRLSFRPDANENGSPYANFTFRVVDSSGSTNVDPTANSFTFIVSSVPDAPVAAAAAESGSGDEDSNLSAQLLAGSDGDGDALTYQLEPGAPAGLTLTASGAWSWTPPANFNGAASFSYRLSDGTLTSAPKSVSLTVNSVDDAPTAANGSETIIENTDHVFTLDDFGFNDVDGDAFARLTVTSLPLNGALLFDSDGDGPGAPVSLSAGSSFAAQDIALGKLIFRPDADEVGPSYASFNFRVSDDSDGGPSTSPEYSFTFDVAPDERPPVAVDDTANAVEDGSIGGPGFNVLANDADPNGDPMTVVGVSYDGAAGSVGVAIKGKYGTLTLNADGSYSYAADADLLDTIPTGTAGLQDVFTYEVSDSTTGSDFGTLTINVSTASDEVTTSGSGANNIMIGDQNGRTGAEDRLNGLSGNDSLSGLGGADDLFGGSGGDKIFGGDGWDELFGESGTDTMDGGAGMDFLDGGSGNDRMTGGSEADTFYFTDGNGYDKVTDFEVGVDRLVIEGITIRGIASRDVDGNGSQDLVVTFGAGGGNVTLLGAGGQGITVEQLLGLEPEPQTAIIINSDLLVL